VLLHLDGAKYHWFRAGETAHLLKLTKEELKELLFAEEVDFDPGELKATLLEKAMSQWGATRRHWLEEYFEEKGWVAARTPPKHPEFQPIELFWAAVKGNIGRAYDTNTTFDIVGRRLRREFDANHDGLIRKLIQSARSAEDA